MRDDHAKFVEAGASIVVVAKHSAQEMKDFWKENNLPYIGIPDPDEALSKLYGQEWKATKLGRMPALFVVDQKGKIAYVHYSNGMSDIPADPTVLGEVGELTKKQ